jgi:isopenicillin N synthase-like dioxygenase
MTEQSRLLQPAALSTLRRSLSTDNFALIAVDADSQLGIVIANAQRAAAEFYDDAQTPVTLRSMCAAGSMSPAVQSGLRTRERHSHALVELDSHSAAYCQWVTTINSFEIRLREASEAAKPFPWPLLPPVFPAAVRSYVAVMRAVAVDIAAALGIHTGTNSDGTADDSIAFVRGVQTRMTTSRVLAASSARRLAMTGDCELETDEEISSVRRLASAFTQVYGEQSQRVEPHTDSGIITLLPMTVSADGTRSNLLGLEVFSSAAVAKDETPKAVRSWVAVKPPPSSRPGDIFLCVMLGEDGAAATAAGCGAGLAAAVHRVNMPVEAMKDMLAMPSSPSDQSDRVLPPVRVTLPFQLRTLRANQDGRVAQVKSAVTMRLLHFGAN